MNFRKHRSRSRKNSVNIMILEKWKNVNRKISRRGDAELNDLDSDSDEEHRNTSQHDWEQEFAKQKTLSDDNSDQDVEVQLTKKQTLLLSTLVPDEILKTEKFDCSEPKRFVGVLLMADVSGYTALSERYNNAGKSGTYRLTVTLNTYLGSLIELIYNHGGDILKFAGDAFLALWKTDKSTFLCHTIHTAIACALLIQHSFSSYETDVKVNLRVKLAISAGNLVFATIGNKIPMNYVVFGLPVVEAKLAESVCASGEVKITPNAWGHCYSRNYDHIVHEDGHVTIKAILYDPREKDVSKPFGGFGAMVKIKTAFCALENLPESIWSENTMSLKTQKKYEALSFRQSILLAEERNIGAEIRKFMIRPVLTQIDAHQPLEYLTEMRQVSVLFVTLKPTTCSLLHLITIVNNSYEIMCEIVYKSMGCVNKIILFDKDVMILVIFGLRGFKHESEAQAALKCACSIKKSISALNGVLEVSIGVTTGQVYCGVVGHPLRREFTVIGATVNKAARLMCYFRNKITCDESTFVKSKMSTNGFTLQPNAELKGIVHAGKIYEYTDELRVKELYDIPMILPLLDRTDEMEYFQNWLDDPQTSYRDFDALLIVGESRLGKTRLMEWMARHSRNNGFSVCTVGLTSIHSATPFLALTQIFNQILDIQASGEAFEKEEKIVQLLKVYDDDLCYLNDILKVRFPYHEGIYTQDATLRVLKAKHIFTKLINCLTKTQVVFLDDLQNLDPVSWQFIAIMIDSTKIFTIMSVCRGKFSSAYNWLYGVLINSNIRKLVLGPLSANWIPPLVCQILDVDAVPDDLCQALQLKCKGLPGLVEMLLLHLFSSGALVVKKIKHNEIEELKDENIHFPDPELFHPQALKVDEQTNLDQFIQDDKKEEIGVCIVTQKDELNTDINVQNLDALIMIQIDALTPYQQLLLKTASVIGDVLSRDVLENIMYENNPVITAKAVKRLFSMRILTCANIKARWQRKGTHMSTMSTMSDASTYSIRNDRKLLTCECNFNYDPENEHDLPKYAFCKVMKFRNKKSRLAFYELLPMNQKKEFHSRIVSCLQNNKHKCPPCGGALMVAQSSMSVDNHRSSKKINVPYGAEKDNEDENEEIQEEGKHKDETRKSNSEVFRTRNDTVEYNSRSASATNFTSGNNSIQSAVSAYSNAPYNPILKNNHSQDSSLRRSIKRVTVSSLVYSTLSLDNVDKILVFDKLREITEAENIDDWHNLGVNDSDDDVIAARHEKYKSFFSIKVEKGVSQTNFNQCTCAELKIMIYEQLIHHAHTAEMKLTEIEFLIKVSHLHVHNNNIDDAFPNLEDAEANCTKPEVVDIIGSCNIQRFLGEIYSIKAAALLIGQKLSAAKSAIDGAMRIYRINLDKVSEFFKIINLANSLILKRKKYRLHKAKMTADSVFCLNIATLIYSSLGDGVAARTSAYRAMRLVQKGGCDVVDMCDVFTNALQVDLMLGWVDATAEVERAAIYALQRLPAPVQADELYAFGKLFMAAFRARIARGQLAAAACTGYRAITVSRFLHAENVSIDIIPDLAYILLSRRRVEEAIDVIKQAFHLDDDHHSVDNRTWYFALCIDLILDAGFQLEPPNKISRFAEQTKYMTKTEDGRRRLAVGLWTYWLRTDFENKAKLYEAEALAWMRRPEEDGTLTALISSMRLAEGMLESLARKIDDLRKVVDLMELRSLADRELIKLENDAKICRAIYPRWILLKANSLKLSGRHSAAASLFNQALEEARRVHNRLEEAIAQAAFSNSPLWLQNARAGSFMSWREAAQHTRGSWHQLLYKITVSRS